MLLNWALKFLTSGVLDKLLSYYTQKNTVDGQVAIEHIKAELATRQAQKEIIIAEQGWAVTRWQRPFVFYPLALHLNLVILDSIFHWDWNVARLPDPIDQWQGAIILSFFLISPVEKALSIFKR